MRRIIALGTSIAALIAVTGVVAVAPAGASDKSVSKQLVITQADAGTGYTAAKGSVSPSSLPQIAACVGKPVKGRVVTSRVAGPDLTNSAAGTEIQSSVVFVKSAKMGKTDAAVVTDPKFPDCLGRVYRREFEAQGVTGVTAQQMSLAPYGTTSVAVAAHFTGTRDQQPLDLTAVAVAILDGRAEINASFTTNGPQPFDQAEGEAILAKLNQRLTQAKVG